MRRLSAPKPKALTPAGTVSIYPGDATLINGNANYAGNIAGGIARGTKPSPKVSPGQLRTGPEVKRRQYQARPPAWDLRRALQLDGEDLALDDEAAFSEGWHRLESDHKGQQ